jgi:predicted enzyme related to lactoylglutathione lyase
MRKLLLTVAAAAVCLVPQSSVAQLAPPNSNGISWGHVHMFINDPDAMKKLFVDVLGGQVANAGRLELVKVSGAMIIMSKAQVAPTEGSEGSTLNHFTLKVKNVADTKAKLVAAGATVVSEKAKSVMMMFPEKVQVEFVEDAAVKSPVVFRNVQINAVDPNALRAWYLKTFPGGVTGTEAGMLTAMWPAGQIDFMKVSSPQAATKGRSLDHMGFEIVGLEAFCKKLESDPTVKFDTTYREMAALGGLKLAYIVDPEGTRIELTEGFGSK